MAINIANAYMEMYQDMVKDAIENTQHRLAQKITSADFEGQTAYVDREALPEAPISIDTSAQPQTPLTSTGIADFAEYETLLTPNMGRNRIRSVITPKTCKWGNWYETEDEFLGNLKQGKVVPLGMKVTENQKDKYILDAIRAATVTRIDQTTGASGAVALPASQASALAVATDAIDYDYVQSIISKFDQVGYSGAVCCALTPLVRDILMKDDRFADNDYAKFIDYGRLDKHTLTDTERVNFIVMPSTSYTMPRTDLAQGGKVADTEMLWWAPEAIEGGYWGRHIARVAPSIEHEDRIIALLKYQYNAIRADDAGVVVTTIDHTPA